MSNMLNVKGHMNKVENLSDSIRSLAGVISASFSFAKSSPSRAKQSLTNAASYLSWTTTQSTFFVIQFWLALLEMLQNEHVEKLVLSLLGILDNFVQILRHEDLKTMLKCAINIASSEPVSDLISNVGNCFKALFYVLRTKEINVLRAHIWSIITQSQVEEEKENVSENDEKKENIPENEGSEDLDSQAKKDRNSWFNMLSRLSIRNVYGMGYGMGYDMDEKMAKGTCNDGNESSSSEDSSCFSSYRTRRSRMRRSSMDGDDTDSESISIEHSTEYDTEVEDISAEEQKQSVLRESETLNGSDITLKRTHSRGNAGYRTLNRRRKSGLRKSQRKRKKHRRNKKSNENREIGIHDWVKLVLYIDTLQDGGVLSQEETSVLSVLAQKQNVELMILYQCYQSDISRFVKRVQPLILAHNQCEAAKKACEDDIYNID